MNRILTLTILAFSFILLSAPDTFATGKDKNASATSSRKKIKYNGSQYMVSSGEYIPLQYTRTYSKGAKNIFYTTYRIYNAKDLNTITIVAKHDKKQKQVEVEVKDAGKGRGATINMEKTSYDTPGMEWIGIRGAVGGLSNTRAGGTKALNQLMVKFSNKKYEHLKVVHIAGPHENTGLEMSIYILDEKK